MRIRSRLVACLLGSTLLVAACSGKATPPTTAGTTTNSAGVVELHIIGHDSSLNDVVIAAFQEKYSNVRVKIVESQGSYRDFIASGQVDVMPLGAPDELVKDNLLLDLGPYIQASEFDLKPYGPTVDSLRTNGKLFALPVSVEPNVMIVNTDLFKAAGVPIPQDWTWEEFRERTAQFTAGEGLQKVWGFSAAKPEQLAVEWLTQKAGNRLQASEEDLKQVLQFAGTLVTGDKSMPATQPRDYLGRGPWVFEAGPFEDGYAAIGLTDLPSIRRRSQTPFRWALVPMPHFREAKPVSVADYVTTYGIAAASPNPKVAWDFLRFLAGAEGAVTAAKSGVLPVYHSAEVTAAWMDRPANAPNSDFLVSTAWVPNPANRPATVDPARSRVYPLQMNAFNRVFSGKASPEQAFEEYKSALQQTK